MKANTEIVFVPGAGMPMSLLFAVISLSGETTFLFSWFKILDESPSLISFTIYM